RHWRAAPLVRTPQSGASQGQCPSRLAGRTREGLVRFWDTSALVPLVVAEPESARVQRWLHDDPAVVVWTLARVEVCSALARRRRAEPQAARKLATARRELLAAWERWTEVTAV